MSTAEIEKLIIKLQNKLSRSVVTKCTSMPTTNVGKIVIYQEEAYFWAGDKYSKLITESELQQVIADLLSNPVVPTLQEVASTDIPNPEEGQVMQYKDGQWGAGFLTPAYTPPYKVIRGRIDWTLDDWTQLPNNVFHTVFENTLGITPYAGYNLDDGFSVWFDTIIADNPNLIDSTRRQKGYGDLPGRIGYNPLQTVVEFQAGSFDFELSMFYTIIVYT